MLTYQIKRYDNRIYHWYNDWEDTPLSAPQSAFTDYCIKYDYKYLKDLNWIGPVHTMIFWKHLSKSKLLK